MTSEHLMDTYKRLPVSFTHGEDCWLYDSENNKYLDALCGISVTSLGHNHPAVTRAICGQAESLLHTSNLYQIQAQQDAAQKLCHVANMDKVFFSNSGAEANEAAIKLARLYGSQQGIARPIIVTLQGSFHGRTMATLTATGNPDIKQGFEPLLDGFIHLPFNDIDALASLLSDNETASNIVAVLIEPVQGEGGIRVCDADYLRAVEQLCNEHNWLFMLDEIQTGNGRCGNYFAYQTLGINPDVVTTAKGLGNGVPVGACLARGDAAGILSAGKHGSTFGGNPLACSAAAAVIDTIVAEDLGDAALRLGDMMRDGFAQKLANCGAVKEIRGLGLMIGIELNQPCGDLVLKALENKLLINVTAGSVVRLLPPLTLSEDCANSIVDTVSNLIIDFVETNQ